MNGTNGSTTITDSGYSGHTMACHGNAKLTTAQKKFGTASAIFDGSGDYITSADSADWDLAAGNFTFSFWVRFNYLDFTR